MKLSDILQAYAADEKNLQLAARLQIPGSKIHLRGLVGSAGAFIASPVISSVQNAHLFILPDKEEAAYFLNDLENLAGKDKAVYFPSSWRRPYETDRTDNSGILMRAEVLKKINAGEKPAIVTYPEALPEKVITRQSLTKNTLSVKTGEKVTVSFITDVLSEYAFVRSDYVIEPGQFSVRGGIIDVFSFSEDYPYRIELSGNEVESIRTFHPVSQLSVKERQEALIIPNVQDKMLLENRQSFLEYIPADTIIWVKNAHQLAEKIKKEFELAQKLYAEKKSLIDHLPPDELYVPAEQFRDQFGGFTVAEYGNRFLFSPDETFSFRFAPQPSFSKNFDMLFQNLVSNAKEAYRNIIFTDTARQAERLYAIFDDILLKTNPEGVSSSDVFTPVYLPIHEGFIDHSLKLACYTDHQIFERYHRFRIKEGFSRKNEAITLKELRELSPGDYVTHIDHGVGRFGGLEKIEVNGKLQETVRLVYRDNDILYISIHSLHRISKYTGKEGEVPKIDKLGSGAWAALKQKTKKKVKEIAFDLIQLYAKRKATKGFSFSPDNYLQNELEASFIYEDTPDQVKSTADVKKDMEKPFPMDRLICGDVGFGKTEIAIRAAFKTVNDSKQVAVLVPTTILALQHFKTFSERLKDFPCTVEFINRFRSQREQSEIIKKLSEGKIDIIIGTHKLVGKEIKFKDLGLLIIDEEQKFGVGVKDKLKLLRTNVDTLTLTATPIPRTLQFSLMGARDLSIIHTPPPNRYPVQTEIHEFGEELIRDAIHYEVSRRGQIFFVHNRVQSIEEMAALIKRLCPEVKIAVGHGQMDGKKLEEVMLGFVEGEYDVLVSTTIIESGLDIPNANTILINDAHTFGLSDLHQMRGRVGRSNKKAFCYLFTPPELVLTSEAKKRLKAIEEFSDLGSGFQLSMRDLDIRGAGNMLGAEQSGFITEIGYEMYQKILDEAIRELKENEFKDLFEKEEDKDGKKLFVSDCQIDTDLEILIPDEYVNVITERLSLYRELDNAKDEKDLENFERNISDRFGPIPAQTLELINTVRLRWLGMEAGFEKLVLKNGKLLGYFVSRQDSEFYGSPQFASILSFVQQHHGKYKFKEQNKKLFLIIENLKNISDAIAAMREIAEAATAVMAGKKI